MRHRGVPLVKRVTSIGRLSSWLTLSYDMGCVIAAWWLSVWLCINFQEVEFTFTPIFVHLNIAAVVIYLMFFRYYGVYRPLWYYFSVNETLRLIKAVVFANFIFIALGIFALTPSQIPYSALVVYPVLILSLMLGARLMYRFTHAKPNKKKTGIKVLLVGAGRGADLFLRELERLHSSLYQVVAMVDDNIGLHGKEIRGVKVCGNTTKILELSKRLCVDQIVIAIPSISHQGLKRILKLCEGLEKPVQTLPSIEDIASGKVSVTQLRDVSLLDLLGRDPIKLNMKAIERLFQDKVVMVTGGAGSIGSELCRQISKFTPNKMIVIDHSEYALYQIEQEFTSSFPKVSFHYHLCNVVDLDALRKVFSQHHPHLVFHAAAYKHVPLLEYQPAVAIQNNILGTRNVAMVSVQHAVEKFVLISTDKAVNPTNIMGTTKRCAEIFCQNYNKQVETQFITVRFGNVLGSNGSVIPLFKKQLKNGGPITVTHPDVERYFMTIPEASQLVLQAAELGGGGEIFVLDMGEPVKIADLAKQLIRLSGKTPGEDIEISYTGLRPGEKIYEELFHKAERLERTVIEKIRIADSRSMDWGSVIAVFESLSTAVSQGDKQALIEQLLLLVPEAEIESKNHAELQVE